MKNWQSYIVALILLGFSSLPFIHIQITAPGEWFPWLFFIAGTLGIGTIFVKTSNFVKIISILMLVNTFLSAVPLLSFLAYIQFILCVYFFILCQKVEDYTPIFKTLQAFLLFNLFMVFMQTIGRDKLLNFDNDIYFGTVGQHMQFGSFSVIIAAALLLGSQRIYMLFPYIVSVFCNATGGFISAVCGNTLLIEGVHGKKKAHIIFICLFLCFLAWIIIGGKFTRSINLEAGRVGVWFNSLKMALEHVFFGWGIGTYKALFPALGGIKGIPWKTAHNCWVQMFFECGIIIFSVILTYFSYLIVSLKKMTKRNVSRETSYNCLAALTMVGVNMIFHFPTRQIQCVLLIVFILAYVDKVVRDAKQQNCDSKLSAVKAWGEINNFVRGSKQ